MAAEILQHDPVLAEIVRRLIEAYRPERIYLFGSTARGDAGTDSDYDLLIIVPDDTPPERRTSRLAYEVLWGTGAAADVLVWPRARFDSRVHLKASLPATVEREGKLLHAEAPPINEAAAALAVAREVYDAVLSRLPAEVRP